MADLNNTLVRGNLRVTSDTDISGNVNASTFNGLPLSGSTGANTIPIRDSNGYVYFNYINTNVGQENPASYSGVSLLFTGSDGWIRKASPSNIDLGDFSNNYGYITSSALSGYATESWVQTRGYVTILDIATTSKYGVTIMGSTEQYDPNPSMAVAGTVAPQGHTHSNYLTNAIVSASVSGNTLTLSPESGSAVVFTPTFTEQYTGTVKSVNNTSPDSNGNVSITIPTYNFSGVQFNSGNSGNCEHNCNDAVDNGHYYYTSNGPSGLGEQSTDGALYVQSYSSSWVAQIAQDYRNGRLWVRGKNNGTWQAWNRIAMYSEIPSSLPANGGNADYATSSTRLYASDSPYRYGDSNPYYAYMTYNSTRGQWYLSVSPATPANIYVDNALNADYATSAGAVAWINVIGKPSFASVATSGSYNDLDDKPTIPTVPTNISSFTNDVGYITSSGSCASATVSDNVSYLTTAPSSANTSGQLKFVVLSSDPSTKYDGYVYIITGS